MRITLLQASYFFSNNNTIKLWLCCSIIKIYLANWWLYFLNNVTDSLYGLDPCNVNTLRIVPHLIEKLYTAYSVD